MLDVCPLSQHLCLGTFVRHAPSVDGGEAPDFSSLTEPLSMTRTGFTS
jgi:hypothetical protein